MIFWNLHKIHSDNKFIHGNINHSNVMYDTNMKLKLIDFNVANLEGTYRNYDIGRSIY